MTITSLTLTNPGAESGSMTGWTTRQGFPVSSTATTAHTGSRSFSTSSLSTPPGQFDQQKDISAFATAIDSNSAAIKATVWKKSTSSGTGYLYVEVYDASLNLLVKSQTTRNGPSSWTQDTLVFSLPAGARIVRIGIWGTGPGVNTGLYWDDFVLEISDDGVTDYGEDTPAASQIVAYVLGSQPAESTSLSQAAVLSVEAAETSSGEFEVYGHHFVAYALVKKHGDKRKLRAWTFPQDDHKFYVLQLGNSLGTLVYDQLSEQWCRWQSSEEVFWRGEDGCDWEGFNVACDPLSGKIFKIDDEGRLDYNDDTVTDDTPITSVVTGGFTKRMRTNTPCYMAELAISEGNPPDGVDPAELTISLRSGDTLGWYDHGYITGEAVGDKTTVRWYGLGLMSYPGRIFEITDTGYARRIDGFNIEIGGNDGQ